MCPKSHQVPEGRHFAEAVVPFHPYDGGVGARARDTLWGWAQGRRPERGLNLCCTSRGMQRGAPTRGFGWGLRHVEPPGAPAELTSSGWRNPRLTPTTMPRGILAEKEQTVPTPQEECARREKVSRKKCKKQRLMPGSEFGINKY